MWSKSTFILFVGSLLVACTPATTNESAARYSEVQTATPIETESLAEKAILPTANRIDLAKGNDYSNCDEQKTLFHCPTLDGKQILLCDRDESLEYSFGKPKTKPELAFSVPRNQATTFQWQGVGRWMSYSVTVPNGKTKYTVFTSLDRLTDEHEFEAGVTVTIGDSEVAKILCTAPIVHNIEGVDLKQEQ
ncbi:MAG: hypothetical protein M3Q13_00095 [Pseudomonadota bacterium]|nr:hypothetical protein [Pseudomonadota bacterium]